MNGVVLVAGIFIIIFNEKKNSFNCITYFKSYPCYAYGVAANTAGLLFYFILKIGVLSDFVQFASSLVVWNVATKIPDSS